MHIGYEVEASLIFFVIIIFQGTEMPGRVTRITNFGAYLDIGCEVVCVCVSECVSVSVRVCVCGYIKALLRRRWKP